MLGQQILSQVCSLIVLRAVFLAEGVFSACYFALHDSLRDTGPTSAVSIKPAGNSQVNMITFNDRRKRLILHGSSVLLARQ